MRWPALLAASAAVAVACATASRPAVLRPTGRQPDLRVALLVEQAAAQIGGQGAVAVAENGRPVFRIGSGDAVRVVADGRALVVEGSVGAGRYQALSFVSLEDARFLTVDGRPYRGTIEVLAAASGLSVINLVPAESYLAGVINAEMGRRGPDERAALEAQAIVSRTYALFNRGKYEREGYDLLAGVADQVYQGVASEDDAGRAAVRATAGMVLTYRDELIEAFFHSTCGYATASPEEVLRFGRAKPYLRSVSDEHAGGYYCDISPRFRWQVEWEGGELRNILRRTLPSVMGIDEGAVDRIEDVRVHRTGVSRRVVELRVRVGSGEIPVFGPDLRTVLRAPDGRSLGSTALQLATERRGGEVGRLVANGAGWGHGIGMCQWGAVGRARAGQSAETIVTTYFPGAKVARWY